MRNQIDDGERRGRRRLIATGAAGLAIVASFASAVRGNAGSANRHLRLMSRDIAELQRLMRTLGQIPGLEDYAAHGAALADRLDERRRKALHA